MSPPRILHRGYICRCESPLADIRTRFARNCVYSAICTGAPLRNLLVLPALDLLDAESTSSLFLSSRSLALLEAMKRFRIDPFGEELLFPFSDDRQPMHGSLSCKQFHDFMPSRIENPPCGHQIVPANIRSRLPLRINSVPNNTRYRDSYSNDRRSLRKNDRTRHSGIRFVHHQFTPIHLSKHWLTTERATGNSPLEYPRARKFVQRPNFSAPELSRSSYSLGYERIILPAVPKIAHGGWAGASDTLRAKAFVFDFHHGTAVRSSPKFPISGLFDSLRRYAGRRRNRLPGGDSSTVTWWLAGILDRVATILQDDI